MTKLELPFDNEIGTVGLHEVTVVHWWMKKSIALSDIKRIGVYRRSSLRTNIIIYLLSFAVLVYYLINLNQLPDLQGIFLLILVIIGFFFAFLGKFYHYTLVLHCRGQMHKFRFAVSKKEELQLFQQAVNLGLYQQNPEMFSEFEAQALEYKS